MSIDTVSAAIISAVAGFGVGYVLLKQSASKPTEKLSLRSGKSSNSDLISNILVVIAMEGDMQKSFWKFIFFI